jgi:hypothetical protein
LPFLARQNLFLMPIGLIGLLALVASLLNINVARLTLGIFVA